MLSRPGKRPAFAVCTRPCYRFRQPVAVSLAYSEIRLAVCRQFVSLVENDKIICFCRFITDVVKHSFPGQGIDADNDHVTLWAKERIAQTGISAANDSELQMEQVPYFPLPIAHQTSWWNYENTADQSAGEHLPHIEPGHDRLAGPGIIGQQESERRLPKHVLVHGQPLMGQWVDQRCFACERRIEEMPIGETMGFCKSPNSVRVGREVQVLECGQSFGNDRKRVSVIPGYRAFNFENEVTSIGV